MSNIKVSAPGKLHLLGEHAIVYNKPAILAAVGKRCFVEITPRKDKKIKVLSKNYNASMIRIIEEIAEKFDKVQKDWDEYDKTNDIPLLKSITKDPLDYPFIIIGQFINHYGLKTLPGFDLVIDSEIPIGAGMGSSGALSVSILGALSLFTGKKLDKKTINEIAFLCEKKKHGLPSGGDNSAVTYGGLIWFRKESPELKLIQPVPFTVPPEIARNFLIIDTGRPKESTGEMIGIVSGLYKSDQAMVDGIFGDQERLTRELLAALKNGNEQEVMAIIKAGSHNLQALGVVSPSTKKLIAEIEEAGGVAKICGAGGSTEASGVVLSYHPDTKILEKIASGRSLKHYQTALGAEGLRQE